MIPYYDAAGITIYHGDCREIMPLLLSGYVLLTDPPYGHGERWNGGTWASAPMYTDAKRWDAEPFQLDSLLLFVERAGDAIIWGGNYYALPPSRCWLAWEKQQLMPTLADFELAWTNLDRPSKIFLESRNPDGQRLHPTQKPVGLLKWCCGFVANDLIVDPFMGSGTTLRAAKDLGRRAIGIEICEEYCEVAARRLSQKVLQWW